MLPSPLSDECLAVRQHAGLFDLSSRGALELTGAERAAFLHRLTTNDVLRLDAGGSRYTMFLTNQGKIIADALVVALESAHWLLVDSQALAVKILGVLERYHFGEDVVFVDRTGAWAQLALQGPHAQRVLEELGAPIATLQSLQHAMWSVDGGTVRVIRRMLTGEQGYLLVTESARGAHLQQRLLAAGVHAASPEALDVLRIEAGIPRYGRDMDETTLQPETGLADAVSDTKGCYIGQEIVARIASQGQVQRRLMGLRVAGATVPRAGDRVRCDGRDVGVITSAALSPALKEPIALAYLHRSAWEPETDVLVGQPSLRGRVAALPFV